MCGTAAVKETGMVAYGWWFNEAEKFSFYLLLQYFLSFRVCIGLVAIYIVPQHDLLVILRLRRGNWSAFYRVRYGRGQC